MENEIKRELVRVNNPDYLQQSMWPLIVELTDILKTPGMSAHSLMTFLLYGTTELWAAIKDGNCIGFICFQEVGAPFYSMGMCNYIYMREKDDELTDRMYEKFIDFLKENSLKYFAFHSQDKKLGTHFKEKWKEQGLDIVKTEYLYTGKRQIGGN